MKPTRRFLPLLFLCAGLASSRAADAPESTVNGPKPDLVEFTSGGAALSGFVYKPSGPGPFPAVLYNHGSDKKPGWFPELAEFWTKHGFVFFVPHRQGHGRSAGEWIVDLQQQYRDKEKNLTLARKHDIELHEKANADVVAALSWLKQQPFVKPDAVVMSGISYGGIQTVLACEKDLGIKAYVPFSPGAMSWAGNPLLRERLLQSVKHATAPVFLLQAKNDYNLGPTELLGAELKRKGSPNRSTLYPVFGKADEPKDGHGGFAVRGSAVWGDDVLRFVNESLSR
jgi:carboxymethylenebutenolidase